ncbi:MAG TPA: CcdB family protein [Steroidobacteraceae bacterium]|nr:CcdB family protein [Steroidobacteraceae bacterium]
MLQFDAFPYPVPALRRSFPFAINLRSDVVPGHDRLLIAPLAPRARMPGVAGRLAPVVRIEGEDHVVIIDRLVSIPSRAAQRPIANLAAHREALIGAIDLLFSGF